MARAARFTGTKTNLSWIKSTIASYNIAETAGSTAVVKIRDSLVVPTAPTAVDGAAGNVIVGLHMLTVTWVTAVNIASGGETAVTGGSATYSASNRTNWSEFTAAGSKIATVTLPTYSRADGQTPKALIVGRRLYVTKAGAPATGVTPTNAQWFLVAADFSTTVAAGMNNLYLPQSSITVASTTGFAASGNLVVQTDLGYEMVSYTSVDATHFLGCTRGNGLLATGNTVTQPMIGDNTSTTYSWNVADASLVNTRPPIVDTSGGIVDWVNLAANQQGTDSFGPDGFALENDGGCYIEVTSGTVYYRVSGG